MSAVDRWMKLGRDGFVVSVAYGPSGEDGACFSVDVLAPGMGAFAAPFKALSFDHAIEVAEIEISNRGWAKQ